jgi:hypothetical protein
LTGAHAATTDPRHRATITVVTTRRPFMPALLPPG